jgi:hypothetical protein
MTKSTFVITWMESDTPSSSKVGHATVQEVEREVVGRRTRHLRWRVRRKSSNEDFFQHFFQLCLFSLETRIKIILIKHRTQ